MVFSSRLFVCTVLLIVFPRVAEAGKRLFSWSYDTEVAPERGVELETWITERIGDKEAGASALWAPVLGITDRLELSLPMEWAWGAEAKTTTFDRYGIDARYRFASPDPVEAGKFVPLLRLAVKRLLDNRDAVRVESNLVLGFDPVRRIHAVLDLGLSEVTKNGEFAGTVGVGVSFAATQDLYVGAELLGEHVLASDIGPKDGWAEAGPALAFVHGRFWLAGTFLIGLHRSAPDFLPRIIWGARL